MFDLLWKLPWRVRALGAWCGTLAGILLLLFVGWSDTHAAHPVEAQIGTLMGWGMAFWGPVFLVTFEGCGEDG